MAPRSLPPAAKQALILAYFHNSGVAHSIKDLEKALPSIASINGMQVKDYLQALSDDNKIRVEKIGSGNWYWAFAGEEKRAKEEALAKAQEERDRAVAVVAELQAKIVEAEAEREEDEDMLLGSGEDRATLLRKHKGLMKEMESLQTELKGYSENDPAEVERRKSEVEALKTGAEKWTEQIQSMESWLRDVMGGDREQFLGMKRMWYGDQFGEEEEGLKEL